MNDLIIRVLSGNASPFEEERLRRWRELAPENEQQFKEFHQVWSVTAPEPVVAASGPPSTDAILVRAEASRFRAQRIPFVGSVGRRWLAWSLLAASVASVGIGLRALGSRAPSLLAEYEAPDGATAALTLADGSFVRLAPGSRLQEWATTERREVSLDGRAFFAVTRDEHRPFVVRTDAGEVRVLGTRFQVETLPAGLETVVAEGIVRMSGDRGSVEVPAGSVGTLMEGEAPSARAVPNLDAFLDWPDGALAFHGTPLEEVAREIARHYGRELQVEGLDLARRRVTASFQGESFEEAAESLCVVTQAACTETDSGVTMRLRDAEGGAS